MGKDGNNKTMPRPQNKRDLLSAADTYYRLLIELIESMSETEKHNLVFGENFSRPEAHWRRDKNLRDVLAHLYHWQHMLRVWCAANYPNTPDKPVAFLPTPYNWRTTPALNEEIRLRYHGSSLADMEIMLAQSHKQVIELIQGFSNEELFTKKYFSWTGTSSLGSYCVSATSSHYDWAIKKLRTYLKIVRANK